MFEALLVMAWMNMIWLPSGNSYYHYYYYYYYYYYFYFPSCYIFIGYALRDFKGN